MAEPVQLAQQLGTLAEDWYGRVIRVIRVYLLIELHPRNIEAGYLVFIVIRCRLP